MPNPSPFQIIPEGRAERWDRLREFADQWYPPLTPADGDPAEVLDSAESRLAVALPPALREWYGIAGRRQDIWSRQDTFLRPEDLGVEEDHLVFSVENQAVVRWGLRVADLSSEDPPVFVSSMDEPGAWIEESDSISLFAIQTIISCIKWSRNNRCLAIGCATDSAIESLESHYPRLPLREWHWPGPTRYYGHRDLVAGIDGGEDRLWVATRTEAAFLEFDRLMTSSGVRWESRSDEWPPGWVTRDRDP